MCHGFAHRYLKLDMVSNVESYMVADVTRPEVHYAEKEHVKFELEMWKRKVVCVLEI